MSRTSWAIGRARLPHCARPSSSSRTTRSTGPTCSGSNRRGGLGNSTGAGGPRRVHEDLLREPAGRGHPHRGRHVRERAHPGGGGSRSPNDARRPRASTRLEGRRPPPGARGAEGPDARGLALLRLDRGPPARRALPPRALRTIYHGFRFGWEARSAGSPSSDVLFVGANFERKGLPGLLRALARVRERVPDVHLHVAGDHPSRRHMEGLAGELGLAEHVIFHGFLPRADVAALYRGAAVLALPSEVE